MKYFVFCIFLIITSLYSAIGQITLLYPGSTATELVDKLVGTGVTYSNVHFVGAGSFNGSTAGNKGIFSGGGSIIGIQSGIIFSTGNAMWAYGPNTLSAMSCVTGTGGEATLQALVGNTTYDAVGVEFDFVPESNYIEFKYVFGSEEYNEFVGDIYNDVFGFFITSLNSDGLGYNQNNIAYIPGTGTAVAINNVNNGYAAAGAMGTGPCTNCTYYRDNGAGSINVEYDGVTVVLKASAVVVPCMSYRMKIVIADVADTYYDSAVFLEENSFTSPTVGGVQITYSNPNAGANNNAVEGCSNANFLISLTAPTPMARNIPFSISGTATTSDFATTPNIMPTYNTLYPNQYYVTIPAGGTTTTLSINPLSDADAGEGTETVILTMQSNLCGTPVYSSATINILDNSTVFGGTIDPSSSAICLGNSVSLSFTNSGGQTPFTYLWSSGQSTSSISANPPSSQPYTVTVTDACGAVTTASAQVDVYPVPAGTSVPATQTICSGETTSLTLTGYPSNTAFAWTAAASGNVTGHSGGNGTSIAQTLENNGSNDATVTYTVIPSANGCSGTPYDVVVTVLPHPVAYNVSGGGSFCPGGSGVTTSLDGSESGMTYNVYVDGNFAATFTGTGGAVSSPNITTTGTVTIVALNTTTGCSYNMNGSATISYSALPQFNSIVIQNVTSCVSPDGSITVTAGGTTGPYQYSFDGGAFSTNNVFTGLNTGFYTVSIQDVSGCINDSAGIQITSTSGPTINSIDVVHNICPGGTAGQITINATPGVEYSIDNGQNYLPTSVFSGLAAGVYYVLVRDAGSCIASQQVTITDPPDFQITESITPMVCGTLGSASISVQGGTTPYNYDWSHDPLNHTFTANNLTNGTYYVTVTDDNGCTASEDLVVPVSGGQGTASITDINNVTCNGDNDGSATVQLDNGIPPYTYSWSHNISLNSATASSLDGGLYYVTISDVYGCSAVLPVNINEPAAITTNITTQTVTCFGSGNGQISLSPQGGNQPYTFFWSDSSTASNNTGLEAGSYSCTITDQNGCTTTASSSVTEPGQIVLSPEIFQPTCYGDSSGSINLTVTGGYPDYVVQWSNNFAGMNNILLTAGTYVVTVTDVQGCGVVNTYIITNPLPMIVNDTSWTTMNGGNASVTVTGGTTPYTYLWSNGSPSSHIENVSSGEYQLTVTDANDCRFSIAVSFDIPLIIPNSITPNDDGKNDDFFIMNIQAFNNISIEIYTRWGEIIFQYKGTGAAYMNEENRWNGTYNGKEMPIGAYLYIVNLGDGSDHITGSVTIIR